MRFSLLLLALLTACAGVGQSPATNSIEKVNHVCSCGYKNWVATMNTGNVAGVAALYADDAVLLATKESTPLRTQEERLAYFQKLFQYKNLKVATTQKFTRKLSADTVAVSGLYTFSYDEKGRRKNIPARFLFVLKKQNDKWLILEHHSSVLP